MKKSELKAIIKELIFELNEASQKTDMECMECGHKFKKKIGKGTAYVKCPKCGGVDTDLA